MEELENKELCAKCGGYCCKAGGCMYFVSDFDNMKLDYLDSVLKTGRVSIKSALRFDMLQNKKIIVTPTLYLKARNVNHGVIDLVSLQTRCASLEENGCHFSLTERPSGGVMHIPKYENGDFACYSAFDSTEEVNKYLPYQKILHRLVKRYTGMSVYEKLKEDIEELFVKIISKDFDDVVPEERGVFNSVWGLLIEAYKEQYHNAISKVTTKNLMKRQLIKKDNQTHK